MSVVMEEEIKRWTARRKAALILNIIQGKTTVAEASRQYDCRDHARPIVDVARELRVVESALFTVS